MTLGKVFLATIIVSAPEFGIAMVTTASGSTELKRLMIAHLPMNDASTGVVTNSNYVDGTAVVCLQDENAPYKAYILAPANFAIGDKNDSLYGRAVYNTASYNETDSKAFVNAVEQLLDTALSVDFKNFAHGMDMNVLPGDSDQIDMNGNAGIHIGRFVAQLRGSPVAFIDVANITHAIRMVANKIEEHLPLSYVLKDKYLTVHNLAINEAEAYGMQDGPSVVVTNGIVEFADDDAIPLYRMQNLEGAPVDGSEELIIGFPSEGVHYCTTEPPVLAKKRKSLTGALSDSSALSISSIKSPAICAIHQVAYNAEGSKSDQDDILQPYDYQEDSTKPAEKAPTLSAEIDDAAINKILDRLFSEDYLDKLKEKMAEHGLKLSSADNSLAADIEENGEEPDSPFVQAPTEDQEFGLPKMLQLTDPVTGRVATYFNTTSFISQEPDGSILICDGYGSEIRMSRGNIYISPALDLFFRPGRDMSAMTPRHQSFNAQGTTTINTAESMYIRAVNNLKMAGATGGSGIVSLECDALTDSQLNGLILRSTSGATLTGHDLYLGINSGVGLTDSRVEDTSKPGTIVIDACAGGMISMRSAEQVIDSKSVCLLAENTALVVNPTSIELLTRTVFTASSVQVVSSKTPAKITVVRNGESVEITTIASENPSLLVEGSLLVGANFTCNMSGKFCGTLIAKGVGSTSPYCGVVSYQYGDPFLPTEIVKPQAATTVGVNVANSVTTLTNTIYQDSYVSKNSFAFPETYNISPTIRVPGMLWQTQTVGGKHWKEPEMESPDGTITMCYPGAAVWNTATVSGSNYQEQSLKSGYITNT